MPLLSLSLEYYTISLLIGGFTAIISGVIVFLNNRKELENQSWLALNVSSAVWSFGYFAMISSHDHGTALIYNWVLHAAAIMIPLFYFLLAISLTKTVHKFKKHLTIASFAGILFLILNQTKFFIADVKPKYIFNYAPDAGEIYFYFMLYFFVLVIYSLFIEFQTWMKATSPIERTRLKYVILFTIAGFGGGGSVFFLTFNINIAPYPVILFSIYPAISAYAVFRHQLFDARIVVTELLTFALWIFILIRTLLSETLREQIVNGGLLFISIILGTLLIKSVLREVQLRERMENLASELASTNSRLRELDKQKTEFVSIASHQLRSPLTAIKGYSSMLLEGSFGEVPPKLKEALDRIFQSSQRLVLVVEDFLNVSRIEQGRMKYDFSTFKLDDVAEKIIEELKPTIVKKGLIITTDVAQGINYEVMADSGKISQVISNLIDNSIKYTPKGSIRVRLYKENNNLILAVSDTGIGMPKETLGSIFEKFSRGKEAGQTNVMGTGLGLYVAKEIVKAHKGKIWAESKGKGHGSTFFVELPIK